MKSPFVFTFVMAIVGAIIGAGFVSGKEIVSFFGGTGYYALILLMLVAILFFLVLYVFAKLGKIIKPKNISDITTAMFGRGGVFVDFGFILSTFITLSSMLAGSDSIGQIMFGANYNFCYIGILTAMIVTLIVFWGLKYIYKITDIILPIMLILILFAVFIFILSQPRQVATYAVVGKNAFSAIIYVFLYVFMNTFSNIFIVAKSGQFLYKKQVGLASVVTSLVLTILVGLILVAILHGGDEIFTSDMPMLAVANSISVVFGVIYSFALWLAIFTTICVAAYTIVQWLNQYINSKFICAVITLSLGFIFSRFGFATIVDIFYPIEGIFGGVFIVYTFVFYLKNKNLINLENNKAKNGDLKYIKKTKKNGRVRTTKKYL